MKRKITIILFLLCLSAGAYLNSQNICIHTKNENVLLETGLICEIQNNKDSVVILYETSTLVYKTEDIDSISYVNPEEPRLYTIHPSLLEGWDNGLIDENKCFLLYRTIDNGGTFLIIGQVDADYDDYIIMKFDADDNVESIYSNRGCMNVISEKGAENRYALIILDDEITIEQINTTKKQINQTYLGRKAIVGTVMDLVDHALGINSVAKLLSNGNEYMSTFLTNTFLGSLGELFWGPGGALAVDLALEYWENKYENDYYDNIWEYMGIENIYISDINEENAPTYDIEVTISTFNNMGKPLGTSIYTGIAVKEGDSNVTYDTKDYSINEHRINDSQVYNGTLTINKYSKETYYVRPYAVVMMDGVYPTPFTRSKYLWGGPQIPYINYGDVQSISYDLNPRAITGECVDAQKKSAKVKCAYYDAKDFNCGVIVKDENKVIQDISTSNNDGERVISISQLEEAKCYTYSAYISANGDTIYGASNGLCTLSPDLTGWWVFNDGQGETGGRTHNVEFYEDGSTNNFYGVNYLHWSVYGHTLTLRWPYVDSQNRWWEYVGTFNEDYTSASGSGYFYSVTANGDYYISDPVPFSLSR